MLNTKFVPTRWVKVLWVSVLTGVALVGSGVVPAIIPQATPAANKRGNSTVFQLANSATPPATNDCAKFDANGNITTAGAACGGGGGGGTVGSGTQFQIAQYTGAGTTTAVAGVTIPDCIDTGGQHVNFTASTGAFSCGATGGGSASGVLLSGPVDPGSPVITFTQSAAANGSSAAFPGSVTSGHLLVLALSTTSNSNAVVSDTRGNTWTQSGATTTGHQNEQVWVTLSGSSGADTVSWSAAGDTASGTVIAEFGGDVTATLDAQSTSGFAAGAPAAITTTTGHDLVLVASSGSGNAVPTTTAPMIAIGNTGSGGGGSALSWEEQTAATTFTPTVSGTQHYYLTRALAPASVVSPGNNGDWYVNTATGVLFGPKTSGVWSASSLSWASRVGANNHILFGGTAPTPSTCGSGPSPSITAESTDNSGVVTVGGGTITACTLTFTQTFTSAPSCKVQTSTAGITSTVSAVSTAAVTFGFSATVNGGALYYSCF